VRDRVKDAIRELARRQCERVRRVEQRKHGELEFSE
jgi:hypothetical protein